MADQNENQLLQRSVLSDKAILRHMELGTVISPFTQDNLSTSSYDVTLGPFFYRETQPKPGQLGVYNPYSETMVKRVWGEPHEAETLSVWSMREHNNLKLENVASDDKIIWISPGETILAHTNEFIGGRGNVTTMMKARSSFGRNFLECCKCAGWGDVGYVNRWTMEITNNSRFYSIPLVVGRRIAQIIFLETEGILDQDKSYEKAGKYQSSSNLDELKETWSPDMMIPKMFRDKEINKKRQ